MPRGRERARGDDRPAEEVEKVARIWGSLTGGEGGKDEEDFDLEE